MAGKKERREATSFFYCGQGRGREKGKWLGWLDRSNFHRRLDAVCRPPFMPRCATCQPAEQRPEFSSFPLPRPEGPDRLFPAVYTPPPIPPSFPLPDVMD